VTRQVQLPAGYQVVFGGQFEEAERSQRNLALLAVLSSTFLSLVVVPVLFERWGADPPPRG